MSKKVSLPLNSLGKKSLACSKAGKLGSSIRWFGHKKVKTKLVRIYNVDYSILSSLASSFGSVASAVHCAIVDSGYNNLSVSQAQARASKEL